MLFFPYFGLCTFIRWKLLIWSYSLPSSKCHPFTLAAASLSRVLFFVSITWRIGPAFSRPVPVPIITVAFFFRQVLLAMLPSRPLAGVVHRALLHSQVSVRSFLFCIYSLPVGCSTLRVGCTHCCFCWTKRKQRTDLHVLIFSRELIFITLPCQGKYTVTLIPGDGKAGRYYTVDGRCTISSRNWPRD
jgi:hypothetical protein